jgi:hypothetical protein
VVQREGAARPLFLRREERADLHSEAAERAMEGRREYLSAAQIEQDVEVMFLSLNYAIRMPAKMGGFRQALHRDLDVYGAVL